MNPWMLLAVSGALWGCSSGLDEKTSTDDTATLADETSGGETSETGGSETTETSGTDASSTSTTDTSAPFEPPADATIGFDVGDVIPNATLVDQNGETVELYSLHGKVLLLDVFAMWCGPCQDHAPYGETIWQELRDEDVVVVALMQESIDGRPNASDARDWADNFGLTHPVLADPDKVYDYFATLGGGYPTYPVIGPDMQVVLGDLYYEGVNAASLRNVLEREGIW